jgi:HlyD family secretion protein
MKKIIIFAIIAIAVIALVVANLMKKEKGIEVTTETIEQGVIVKRVTGSGQIKPAVDVNISANVAGKILELNAKEGDQVQAGQFLVALDSEQYQASVRRAESMLITAKANEKKSESELNRSRELFKQNLVSQSEYEAALASYEAAKGNRMQAEASLSEAQESLRKTKLYTPMAGTVTKTNKEVGEMAIGANFQEDVILIVSDLSIMEAVIEVDENDVINIEMGDSADVEVDAFPDTLFRGKVTEIANSAVIKGLGTQEQVTNFEVTITIENADLRFRPGMSTTVDIYTDREENVFRIPIQAVTVRDKEKLKKRAGVEDRNESEEEENDSSEEEMIEVVFIAEDDLAIAKPVKLGISDDTHYAIQSGLNEGQEVITGPFKVLNKTLKNEDKITVKSKKKK